MQAKQTKLWHELVHIGYALAVVLALIVAPVFVSAQTAQTPQQGSVGISGVVGGDPPSSPAVITAPVNGSTISDVPATVRGSCPADVLVQIYRNGVFAGSTLCVDSTFELIVDLIAGQNSLQARIFDALNQRGPDSNTVNVTYNPPSFIFDNGQSVQTDKLLLTTNFASLGVDPGQELVWPIRLSGGSSPYAISVNWGDASEPDLYSVPSSGVFDIKHRYERSGSYIVTIKATDASGRVSFLQVVSVVNGPAVAGITQTGNDQPIGTIRETIYLVWPLYVLLAILPVMFVVGRRYELRREQGKIAEQQRRLQQQRQQQQQQQQQQQVLGA